MRDTPPLVKPDSGEVQVHSGDRLESWKEIAAYLKRDVRTVQRWERSGGLPVRRLKLGDRGTVHASRTEIDAWWQEHSSSKGGVALELEEQDEEAAAAPPSVIGMAPQPVVELPLPPPAAPLPFGWPRGLAVFFLTLVLVAAVAALWNSSDLSQRPQASLVPVPPRRDVGRLLAEATRDGGALRFITVGRGTSQMALTPDGRELYVASAEDRIVHVIDTVREAVTHRIPLPNGHGPILASPDGQSVLVGSSVGELYIVDTRSKRFRAVAVSGSNIADLAILPDARKLYVALDRGGLKTLRLDTLQVNTIPTTGCPHVLALTPDGRRLYVDYQCGGPRGRNGHDSIDVLDTASDRVLETISGLPNVGEGLAMAPDGTQIWVDGGDACVQPQYDHEGCPLVPGGVIHIFRTSNNSRMQTFGLPEKLDGALSFFPDGQRVALSGLAIHVVHASTLEHVETYVPRRHPSGPLRIAPDGRKAFVALSGGAAEDVVAVIPIGKGGCRAPWEPQVWWAADGTANDTLAATDGELQGAVRYGPGYDGQAFELDGVSAFVRFRDHTEAAIGGDFSVSLWVRPQPRPAGTQQILLDRMLPGSGLRQGWRLLLDGNGAAALCVGGSGAAGCGADHVNTVRSREPLPAALWTHLTAVLSRGMIALYVDGREQATRAVRFEWPPGSQNIHLGASTERGSFFQGRVDEIRFYRRALAAQEVRQLDSALRCYD